MFKTLSSFSRKKCLLSGFVTVPGPRGVSPRHCMCTVCISKRSLSGRAASDLSPHTTNPRDGYTDKLAIVKAVFTTRSL